MELSIGLVLMFVTLVTATPHGYGVKGGASAKAEASAVAGGFGNVGPIPLSIPSGAAYSGSFSKSSSSSFASSSASASSSSYSFSGSGTNGIAQIGGLSEKGCSTGTCLGEEANGPTSDGAQPFGGVNAVATAQAKALSGAFIPCQGSKCNSSPTEKCSSGQCPTDTEKENHKCSTGNCQPNKETESPLKETGFSDKCPSGKCKKDEQEEDLNDSNDFAVNINRDSQGKSSQGLNGQYYNKQRPLESSCSNGKCGTDNSYPNDGTNKHNRQPVPATYLTTPNHNEPCTTPNCKSSLGFNQQSGGLPSSYNVPLQSATNPPDTSFSQADDYENPSNENKNKNLGPCEYGRCNIHSGVKPSNGFGVSSINSPSYSHGIVPSGHIGKPDCKTPNCGDTFSYQPSQGSSTEPKYTSPAHVSLPDNKPINNCKDADCSGPFYSGLPAKSSTEGAPVYTGGFGGPAGILDTGINKFPGTPANQYVPSHPSSYTQPTGSTLGHDSFGTTKPNDLSPGSHYGTNFNGPSGNYPSNSYSPTPSTHFNPTYVNSFGTSATSKAPSGIGSHFTNNHVPSVDSSTSTGDNKHGGSNNGYTSGSNTGSNSEPSTIHGSFSVTNPSSAPNPESSPSSTGGYYTPAGNKVESNPTTGSANPYKPGYTNCGSAGCNTFPIQNCGTLGCNGQPGYVDASFPDKTRPNTPGNSQEKPVYTGGFGGSTGSIDGSSPTFGPTGSYNPGLGNCGSAGCSGQHDNTGSSPYNTKTPNTPISSQATPVYSGGFGAPTGTPYESTPTFGPTGSYKPNFTNCGSKGCIGQPSSLSRPEVRPSSQVNPEYADSLIGVTGSSDGSSAHKYDSSNCGVNGCTEQPTSNHNSGLTSHDKAKPSKPNASQTKPTYSGGFGGPSGLLKPNEYSIPTTSSGNSPCVTGTCVPKDASSFNHGQGNSLTGVQSLAAATASANAIAYTGGFGGPPGVLKAYDNGKINGPIQGNSGTHSPNFNPQNQGNGKNYLSGNSVQSGNGLNSVAQAIASATASAGSNSEINNHQNGTGGPRGCNSGCPNNDSHGDGTTPNASSSASAKSIAGANSFGFGGSFASSSANAHATAGAATKGGYGRK